MGILPVDKRLDWLARCLERSFRLYPRSHRQEFEQEMRQVFRMAAQEIYPQGLLATLVFFGRELRGVLGEVVGQYWQLLSLREGKLMQALEEFDGTARKEQGSPRREPLTWGTLLAGSAIFMVWGLDAILREIIFPPDRPELVATMTVSIFLLSWLIFLLPPVVVGYAWTRYFPRWTYPYVGAALLYAVLMDGIPSPHFPFSGGSYIPWGWRAWIPLVLAVGVGLFITHSLRPLRRFFTNTWEDWTLLSYAMFGWAPLFLLASFDEIASGYTMTFMPLVVILMVTTVLLYLASRHLYQRAWALFAGAFLSLGITLVTTEVYWMGVSGFDMRHIALIQAVFLGVMFAPGLIGVFRHFGQWGAHHYA